MKFQANHQHRPFLDVTEAEATADLGALTATLSRAVQEAEVLGLLDVKEHLDAALARAVEQGEEGA